MERAERLQKKVCNFVPTTCFSAFALGHFYFQHALRMFTFSLFRKNNTRLREILPVFLVILLRVLKLHLKRSKIVVGNFVENMET